MRATHYEVRSLIPRVTKNLSLYKLWEKCWYITGASCISYHPGKKPEFKKKNTMKEDKDLRCLKRLKMSFGMTMKVMGLGKFLRNGWIFKTFSCFVCGDVIGDEIGGTTNRRRSPANSAAIWAIHGWGAKEEFQD